MKPGCIWVKSVEEMWDTVRDWREDLECVWIGCILRDTEAYFVCLWDEEGTRDSGISLRRTIEELWGTYRHTCGASWEGDKEVED